LECYSGIEKIDALYATIPVSILKNPLSETIKIPLSKPDLKSPKL